LEQKKGDIKALVVSTNPSRVDNAFLEQYPSLQVVSNNGVGVDHIDVAACKQRGERSESRKYS